MGCEAAGAGGRAVPGDVDEVQGFGGGGAREGLREGEGIGDGYVFVFSVVCNARVSSSPACVWFFALQLGVRGGRDGNWEGSWIGRTL